MLQSRLALAAVGVLLLTAARAGIAAEPVYSADLLESILKPAPLTRSLTPGEGKPKPGQPGSGAVPDLKLLFKFNSAELLPEATAQLDALADALSRDSLATFSFRIGGHTDTTGPEAYNQMLSEQRAASAVTYLVERHGIDPSRLDAEGYGESQLADPNNPTSARNRRVEVITIR